MAAMSERAQGKPGSALERVEAALSRLGKTTNGRGTYQCPAHNGDGQNLSVKEEGGRVLLNCFAYGCTFKDLAAAMDLSEAEFFDDYTPPKAVKKTKAVRRERVAEYLYTDRHGEPLRRKVRLEPGYDGKPKAFTWELPDPSAREGWRKPEKDVEDGNPHVLYNLPLVVEAETVHLCEGEKAAEALQEALPAGHAATCTPAKWEDAFVEALGGKVVVIWVDRDGSGEKQAATPYWALEVSGSDVTLAQSKDESPSADAFDHLAAGFAWDDYATMSPDELPVPKAKSKAKGEVVDGPWSEQQEEPAALDLSSLITNLGDVKPKPWEYLFRHRIAYGVLTMLMGEPGLGKSAVIADLAARLTNGRELPDGLPQEPIKALLMTREDDPERTLQPRYQFAGATTSQVDIWDRVPVGDGRFRPPNIVDHHDILEGLIRENGYRLLIVDPFLSFLPVKIDASKNAQAVADALNDLQELVRRLNIACVILAHPRKGGGGKAIDRVFGSVTIGGTLRSVMELREDPEDDGSLILSQAKSNIGPMPNALRLSISTEYLETPDSVMPIEVSSVQWGEELEGVTSGTLDRDAMDERKGKEPSPAVRKAGEWLETMLSGARDEATAIPRNELIARGRTVDHYRSSLLKACKEVGVETTEKAEFGGGVRWFIRSHESPM